MADTRLTQKTELAETPHNDDVIHVVDVSDTTDHAEGTSFKVRYENIRSTLQKAFDAGQTITIADTVNDSLVFTNNDVTNNPIMLDIVNNTTANAIRVTQGATVSASQVTGGAVNITNGTTNNGPALVVHTNVGATTTGQLAIFRGENAAMVHDLVRIVSDADNNSALAITGKPTGKGIIKVVHTGNTSDGNSSGISIDLQGSGTAAQGIFVDATGGGTTGKLVNIRNAGSEYFTVLATAGVVVNETGTSTGDFRVEGDTDTEVFFVDASADMAGVSTTTPTSRLHVLGSFATAYTAFTSGPQTLDATHRVINCTSGTFTINLPTAVGIAGREYVIKNSGTGIITVDADGTETIDGALTSVLGEQYDSITVVSNGANWIII